MDEQTLLDTAVKIDKNSYKKAIEGETRKEHVELAEKVLRTLHIIYYNENFYVYNNGVYKPNLPIVEQAILKTDINANSHLRQEVLNHIRILKYLPEKGFNINLINFKNGILNLETNELQMHDPVYFTVCQINANYLDDDVLEKLIQSGATIYIDNFLNDICCKSQERINCVLEFLGYSLTYNTKLKKCLFLLGETADNGKSTFLDLVAEMFGYDNTANTSIVDMNGRFYGAELLDKLINVCHELENFKLADVSKFKTIIAGDSLKVEEKYKNRFTMKPFTHHIFAMNNLPDLMFKNDEGFFSRLHIIRFEAKFTDKEKESFNFDNLITRDSLDYLANISLRKYLQMRNEGRREFSNRTESQTVLSEYKELDNSALQFINQLDYNVFDKNGLIKKTSLLNMYNIWCKSNNCEALKKNEFYSVVLSTGKFVTNKGLGGYDCFKKLGGDSH